MKKTSFLSNPLVVGLIACFCCGLWGSAFSCVKLGYDLFAVDTGHTPSILLFAGLRFFIAGLLAVLFGSLAERKLLLPKTSRTWSRVFKLSLLQTIVQYFLFYIGLTNTTGVKASIISASNSFTALLVAVLIFHQEKLTGRKLLGCIIGFTGVVLVNLGQGGLGGGFRFDGEGFIFFSAVSYAFSSVFLKRYSHEDHPVLLSGWQFIVGGSVLILAGLLGGGTVQPSGAGAFVMLLYLGFISAAAYSLWGILLKHNPISHVTVYSFMTPVFGVSLSALLLDENNQAFGLTSIAALVLVCIGIYIVNNAAAIQEETRRS